MSTVETRATTLWSMATVRAYLKIKTVDSDAILALEADSASARVEAYCRRLFVTRPVVEQYTGDRTADLALRNFPIQPPFTALSMQSTPGDTPLVLVEGSDYDVDYRLGRVRLRALRFPSTFQGITASYNAGFGAQDSESLPADVVEAGLAYLKSIWNEYASNAVTVSSLKTGPSMTSITTGMSWTIKQALDRWKAPRL